MTSFRHICMKNKREIRRQSIKLSQGKPNPKNVLFRQAFIDIPNTHVEETSTRFFTIQAGAAGPAAGRPPPAAGRPPHAAGRPARVSLTRRRSCVELCARSLAASHVFLLGSAGESGLAAAVAGSLARCLDLARCVG